MSEKDLLEVIGDKDKAREIYALSKEIQKYGYFKSSVNIGISYGPKDLSFTEMLLYSWIEGRKNGRKT